MLNIQILKKANKIRIILALLIVIATNSITYAAGEMLIVNPAGSKIDVKVYDFQISGSGPQWYQIRYYPPGQPITGGTYYANPPFEGSAVYAIDSPRADSHDIGTSYGEWTVALFKGETQESMTDEIVHIKQTIDIVPIPEFPVIAFPVAAVMAIMFIIRKNKF